MPVTPVVVANSQINGGAATHRMRWPRGMRDGGDPNAVDKFGGQDYNGCVLTNLTGGGTSSTIVYGGAAVIDYVGSLVTYSRALSWFTERAGGSLVCDTACLELRVTAAFPNPVGVIAADYGLLIYLNNNNGVNGDGTATFPGVIFGPQNANTIQLRARAAYAGLQTVTETVAAAKTPDMTKFNTYAIRVVSGSPSSDPVLFGLINGQVVTDRYSWTAAAGLLPRADAAGGQFGYQVGFGVHSNGLHAYIQEVVMTLARTEADLN